MHNVYHASISVNEMKYDQCLVFNKNLTLTADVVNISQSEQCFLKRI